MNRRICRALRYLHAWWWYWLRMSLAGLAAGILIAGLYNQASVSQFDYPRPPTATHAAP